jgi:hypothetical protein
VVHEPPVALGTSFSRRFWFRAGFGPDPTRGGREFYTEDPLEFRRPDIGQIVQGLAKTPRERGGRMPEVGRFIAAAPPRLWWQPGGIGFQHQGLGRESLDRLRQMGRLVSEHATDPQLLRTLTGGACAFRRSWTDVARELLSAIETGDGH